MTSNEVSQDQTPALPEWIRVLPRGVVELSDHREPFMVDEASLMSMAADFRSRGVDLVIDYEHQSLQGERAPAAGWIKELEARSRRPLGPGGLDPAGPGIPGEEGVPLLLAGTAVGPRNPPARRPDAHGPDQRAGYQAPAAPGGEVGGKPPLGRAATGGPRTPGGKNGLSKGEGKDGGTAQTPDGFGTRGGGGGGLRQGDGGVPGPGRDLESAG